eukprot:CAMPEP_0181341294 /NCGR_PEP_ID=MMETSP1101-20121128/30327_1 /TAXON_ID=46948 /ORGANISM="Rhodomonas abbreviata, Strain Caron Lab Isolate" /LENGTH=88 /DNA_ID=CAMNT_0023452549 /DNA_START=437 /DNA_END=700 /DNA_ORIENTATION=-
MTTVSQHLELGLNGNAKAGLETESQNGSSVGSVLPKFSPLTEGSDARKKVLYTASVEGGEPVGSPGLELKPLARGTGRESRSFLQSLS